MRTLRLLLVLSLTYALTAQEFISSPKFPSTDFFRQFFGKETPKVELQPVVRLQDFVYGDRLELSLRGYLELVMANLTDVQLTKLTLETFKNAITRGYGRFDPFVNTAFTASRATTPTTQVTQGAAVLSQLSQPFLSTYVHTLESGTQYQVGFGATKQSDNNTFSTFNPSISSNMTLRFIQPLLQNRGRYVNRLPIMIARSRVRQNEYLIKDQLLTLLQAAEQQYWNVIQSRENLKVQEEGLKTFKVALDRNKRELELGAISALEIYQPEQNYAQQEVTVTQARYDLELQLDLLRRQMGADLDPQFRGLPIVLTEPVFPQDDGRPLDKEQFVETGYRMNPLLKAKLQEFDIDDLTYKTAKNSLRPQLNFTGTYISNGRGGNAIPRTNTLGVGGLGLAGTVIPGGLGDALDHVFGFDFPTYTMGISFNLPLRNRASQADLADAIVTKRQDVLQARQIEQTIRQQVLNAVTNVESSRAGIKLAQVALDFSQKRLDAEQKRYDLGVTTIFFLITAQQDLVTAQGNVVRQAANYRRAMLNLLRLAGTLLDERGIVVQY